MLLKDQVAIVTGGSRGIGKACVLALAGAGAKVAFVYRGSEDAAKALEAEILAAGGVAKAIQGDVAEPTTAERIVSSVLADWGRVDILVNNAAVNPVFGPVVDTSLEAFDKIMAVNVKGPFELAKKMYPILKAKKSGSVINISSIGGLRPEHGLGIYSMSKAALISLTKVFAKEWGDDNIRANVICPGLIKTKFSEALWSNDKMMAMMMKVLPIKRVGTPEEIAALALYLASDSSAYCTGSVFTADGGFTI